MLNPYAGWMREMAHRLASVNVSRGRLENIGWVDFQADPPIEEPTLIDFVVHCVEVCCFDGEHEWNGEMKFLAALLGATKAVISTDITEPGYVALRGLMLEGYDSMGKIRDWFVFTFK